MSDELADLEDEFPLFETYVDCSGRGREFEIDFHMTPVGFLLRATETGAEIEGYEFEAKSDASPFSALGRLRTKIRRGLATRYLDGDAGRRSLTHDQVKGRIGDGGVIIDGERVSFEEFADLLQTYEGFQFSLRIVDGTEEV